MAEAFRSQLLRDKNRVQPCSDQPCMICLTQCDTLCPETGTVEWEVRLPCKHTVGSICITKWLDPSGAANNTCPMCRYVFFPKQPRPHLEHGIFDGDDLTPAAVLASNDSEPIDTGPLLSAFSSDSESDMSSDSEYTDEERRSFDFETIRVLCETYCRGLEFASSPRMMAVSEHLARKGYDSWRFGYRRLPNLVAFTVLVVSHIMGVPRSLFQVARVAEVDDRIIFAIYRIFLRSEIHREGLLDEEIVGMIDRGDFETVLTYLPEERGLFFAEENRELIERGGFEVFRSLPVWRSENDEW